MADNETDVERIRRRLQDLEVRVHTLESIAIRSLSFVAACLLALGSALPVFTDGRSFDPMTVRLLTAPFAVLGALGEDADEQVFGAVMGLVFLVLLACVLTAVGICLAQWRRWGGPGLVLTAQVVAVLLLVGMLAPVLLTFGASNPELDDTPGPAVWYFVPGVILFAAMAFNGNLRRLWSGEE
ncbi:hypothetical protein [Glycomyces algeriensis]|uniref:Uncharacterized protein n=1 Tax=Glycomyces algeriensis TaxID=256037 RepID=A0A9W6G9V4_9ACTN|nr:hypothetical protein [Glycomyces algeriensis]MDA1364157.1 hypothetical protein [Glycomyces algeriensis]MDR7350182.1 tetrahydromethanopterin S-methyltransferase subunit G [Glycomyces algeriensis]GLI42894.1 hypothetical protein GALLR39Z86_27440 [Glycomyces algeriensis]